LTWFGDTTFILRIKELVTVLNPPFYGINYRSKISILRKTTIEMRFLAFLLLCLLAFFNANAQSDDCPCCTESHRAFDFWVGDWVVYDTLGTEIGENLVVKLQDDCIIQENWIGKGGVTGSSYNFYNLSDSTWNQLWIDSQGNHLNLKGWGNGEIMVMKGDKIAGQRVPWYYNQITWKLLPDQSVSQTWEIFDGEGKLLNTAFVGIYKKRPE
jgi:hypothetical protein